MMRKNPRSDSTRLEITETRIRRNPYVGMVRDYPDILFPENPGRFRGGLQRLFDAPRPIVLEIGAGSGGFLRRMAAERSDRNFIAIDVRYKRLVKFAQKIDRDGLSNVKIFRMPAQDLPLLLKPGDLSEIWIQFPEPWLKRKRRKHRLISDEFAAFLAGAMAPDARLYFKTDQLEYALATLERMRCAGLLLEDSCWDLHGQRGDRTPPLTEFESLFKSKGDPVRYFEMRKPRGIVLDLKPDSSWKRYLEA